MDVASPTRSRTDGERCEHRAAATFDGFELATKFGPAADAAGDASRRLDCPPAPGEGHAT